MQYQADHLAVQYSDGDSSAQQFAELSLTAGGEFLLKDKGRVIGEYAINDCKLSALVAGTPAYIILPEGGMIECKDAGDLNQLLKGTKQGGSWLHKIESKLPYALAAVVIAVISTWLVLDYGVPGAAKHIAYNLPTEWEQELGDDSFATLDAQFLEPSHLEQSRQDELRDAFFATAPGDDVKLYFRSSSVLGANAFALPGGIMVITDDLIKLAEDDREILAVMGHELGHIRERHGVRHMLQSSILALGLLMITGDASTFSGIVVGLPVVIVESGYSRDLEREADVFAMQWLDEHGIERKYLGSLLLKLQAEHGGSDIPNFLSTHPATEERAKASGAWEEHLARQAAKEAEDNAEEEPVQEELGGTAKDETEKAAD